MHSKLACDFVSKLKENDTLEELTLNEVKFMENYELFEVEKCVWKINKIRSTKDINNLKVTSCYYNI